MRFVETTVFTARINQLIRDDEYRRLQLALIGDPQSGDLMRRAGGARKMRWGAGGKGKRGGIRVIYYWDGDETFFMLYVFAKNEQATLTRTQEAVVKRAIHEEFP